MSVAKLLHDNGAKLRRLLNITAESDDAKPMYTVLAELQAQNAELSRRLLEEQTSARRLQDAWRKAAGRLKVKNQAATAARRDEREKLHDERMGYRKEEQQRARERAEADVHDKLEREKRLKNGQAARARDAEAETRKLSRKLRKLEKEADDTEMGEADDEMDVEAEDDSDEEDLTRRLPFELLPRRDEATGRWQAESTQIHAVRLAQLARGVSPSTTAMNITDVLKLVAPDVEVPGTCTAQAQLLRTEVTVSSQAMAAFKFAMSIRVLSFGWDESTKFGDGVLSCNAQVKYADGTIENICLRGLSILPEGGTSAAVLAHIETRIFAHSRRLLTEWKVEYEKVNGAGSWAAAGYPSSDSIGLHRLAEDTMLSTDKCNGACCTRRMLAEAIMQCIKDKVGIEAWEAMSDEERDRKYKTYRGDCWQHLRNIVIDAMAAKGDAMLRLQVADDLSMFNAFERNEPDGGSMIHACFKHFHHIGEYHHGRGREYKVWSVKNHASRLLPHFQRSCGNRQDLKFDGCIPLLLHRLTPSPSPSSYVATSTARSQRASLTSPSTQ